MTITYTIPGATLIDQLNEPTSDGLVDENASDNCVAASLSEGLHILTGRAFNGDELKDAVYGQGWKGFQGASAYVAYCAKQGVTLTAHNDTQAGLVATIHAQVSAGHPVIVTMPSQWGTAPADPVHPSGTTHVGIAVGVGPGMIRVMNPWHGFFQDQADSWWAARLCEGQVWVMQKASGATMTTTVVPTGWTYDAAKQTLTASNGVVITNMHNFCDYILQHPHDANDLPEGGEMHTAQVELSDSTSGDGYILYFQHSELAWTQAKGVYPTYAGAEALAGRRQMNALQVKLATAEAQAQHDAATIGAQSGQIATLTQQVAQLTAQVKNLQATPSAPSAPTTPADAAALLVSLIYAQADATLKAASSAPTATAS